MMKMMAGAAVAPLWVLALCACSVTSTPRNSVLAPEQQQLGERRIYTSATPPTPQEAVKNFISEGTGAVPVVLIKSDKLFVQHVFDTQASLDVCVSLLNDRAEKAKSERDGSQRRAYYCVAIENGQAGSATQVGETSG